MNKAALIDKISDAHLALNTKIEQLDELLLLYTPPNKWSAGQQLAHIIKSVAPVNMALDLPSFILKLLFGKANRPSKSYEALVDKYKLKLATGGKATAPFIPKAVVYTKKELLIQKLSKLNRSLIKKVDRYSEEQLDTLLLPHPLLGKLTLREMLYFTAYHARHHIELVEKGVAHYEASHPKN